MSMIEQSIVTGEGGWLPRHFDKLLNRFKGLIDTGNFHFWIAGAILERPATLAPMIVEREETLEENLELVFLNLDPERQDKFRAAITRTVQDEKFWPPKELSESEGLRDIVRLVRLSWHHELSGWIGTEIANLAVKPKTAAEYKAFGDTIAIMADIEKWAPQAGKDGSNYRIILDQLRIILGPRTPGGDLIGPGRPINITPMLAALRAGLT